MKKISIIMLILLSLSAINVIAITMPPNLNIPVRVLNTSSNYTGYNGTLSTTGYLYDSLDNLLYSQTRDIQYSKGYGNFWFYGLNSANLNKFTYFKYKVSDLTTGNINTSSTIYSFLANLSGNSEKLNGQVSSFYTNMTGYTSGYNILSGRITTINLTTRADNLSQGNLIKGLLASNLTQSNLITGLVNSNTSQAISINQINSSIETNRVQWATDTNTWNTTAQMVRGANSTNFLINWSLYITDTNTWNTTIQMIKAVNNTRLNFTVTRWGLFCIRDNSTNTVMERPCTV